MRDSARSVHDGFIHTSNYGTGTMDPSTTVAPTAVSDLFDVTLELTAPPPSGTGDLVRVSETLRLLRPTWSTAAERKDLRDKATQRIKRQREAMR